MSSRQCLAILVLAALVLAPWPPVARAAPPTIALVAPTDNAVIGGGALVAVIFRVTDFNLTSPGTTGTGLNEGYVEVFVDSVLFAAATSPTVILPLGSGSHTVLVRLVATNGTPLDPEVNATATFRVTRGPASGTPGIAITYPEDFSERGPDTEVSFRTTGFALVPPGAAPAPNEGHLHILLDGAHYGELTTHQPAAFSDLPVGEHTVTLELVDGAHQPLAPPASSTVRIQVVDDRAGDLTPALQAIIVALLLAVLVVLAWPRRREK